MNRHGKISDENTTLQVVVPKTLKASLQKLAAKERRKFPDYIRVVLEDIVAAEEHALAAAEDQAKQEREKTGAPKKSDVVPFTSTTYPKRPNRLPPRPPVAGAG